MSPSHSNTRNRRYRYYVSQALIQCKKHKAGSTSKIPAGEIEAFVVNEVKIFLSDTKNVRQVLPTCRAPFITKGFLFGLFFQSISCLIAFLYIFNPFRTSNILIIKCFTFFTGEF
jgi:hypothetical protein